MKHPYKTLISSIALGSALAFAQATQPAEAVPAADTQAQAAQEAPAQAPAADSSQAKAPEPAQAAAAQPVADSTVSKADTTAAAPATAEPSAATPAVAAADSAAAPAADTTAAKADSATTQTAAANADSAATQTAAANADSAAAGFVADTATPPPSLLAGTEISGAVHGFMKVDKSPYLVTGDLSVAPNTALVIEPGVVLYFKTGTGLYVNKGQLVIAGSKTLPVQMRSAFDRPKSGDWKGVFISGDERAEIRNLQISDAEVAIAVENGSMDLQNTSVENTSVRGVFARNSEIKVSDCEFSKNRVAVHISNYADGSIERSKFTKNEIAILNSKLANVAVSSTEISENELGVLSMDNSLISLSNTKIEKNKIGISSAEVLAPEIIENVKDNDLDMNNEAVAAASVLPPNPEIPGIEQRAVRATDKIADIVSERAAAKDTTAKRWTIIGNAMLGGTFHLVTTSKNDSDEAFISGKDTIAPGEKYKNIFQVPGLAGNASAYLYMQSPDGKTIEFTTDLTVDSWNHFSPNPVTLRYMDSYNSVALGDFQLVGGETYMANLPVFGADYTVSLLKNNANQPLFQLNGFFGEARRSLVEGARHPNIYNDYIDDGELQAQRLASGGFIKWAPVRRFDAKFGLVYATDELEDPLLRDGASGNWTTSEPIQKSLTLYADGNWLFFPGDIELNGQIAVGRADTADVIRQRAINKVFAEAGVSPVSYSFMRKLMRSPSKIDQLSEEELYSIFGDNTTMRKGQMTEKLKTLIEKAKLVQTEEENDRDDDRVLGLNWGSQNFAIGASLNWNIYKTSINGHIKYVGEEFYSAGSPDQLSDTREFGGRIDQEIFAFWSLGFEYQINVENAAKGDKTNIFGLGEGSEWGLFANDESSWFTKHELDNDRTKYIHNIGLDNTFKITKNIDVTTAYNFEYKNQYRPFQLHGDYILSDGIYRDKWFNVRKGRDSTMIIGEDTTYVDAERWGEYMGLASEPWLASRFQERLFKHSWNLGASLRALNSVFKVNGRWTYRTDGSVFERDSLIEDMELSNTTWDKLGYFFGGSNYFEQCYPMSVTTTLSMLQNRFAITPRIKSYNRDNMGEFEITVEDEFEMPFKNRFFVLTVNASFRYMNTDWEEDGKNFDETEIDVLSNANLRVNHNKKFYTEWILGNALYVRPDNPSNEYNDFYVGVNAHYVF